MIDLDYYTFREPVPSEEGGRLLAPHADPRCYEWPLDYMWATEQEARDWLAEAIDDETIDRDEADAWVLVHYVGTIVGNQA
jgi:hypothetical protein